MVGGLADWFAVTALFRHPLGIPIPHTAIIPERKDQFGRDARRVRPGELPRRRRHRRAGARRPRSCAELADVAGRPGQRRRSSPATPPTSWSALADLVRRRRRPPRPRGRGRAARSTPSPLAPLAGRALRADDRRRTATTSCSTPVLARPRPLPRREPGGAARAVRGESPWWLPGRGRGPHLRPAARRGPATCSARCATIPTTSCARSSTRRLRELADRLEHVARAARARASSSSASCSATPSCASGRRRCGPTSRRRCAPRPPTPTPSCAGGWPTPSPGVGARLQRGPGARGTRSRRRSRPACALRRRALPRRDRRARERHDRPLGRRGDRPAGSSCCSAPTCSSSASTAPSSAASPACHPHGGGDHRLTGRRGTPTRCRTGSQPYGVRDRHRRRDHERQGGAGRRRRHRRRGAVAVRWRRSARRAGRAGRRRAVGRGGDAVREVTAGAGRRPPPTSPRSACAASTRRSCRSTRTATPVAPMVLWQDQRGTDHSLGDHERARRRVR